MYDEGMKIIPREARRITYSTEIRNLKQRLHLSDIQKAVVIGNILGDGHLEPNWSRTNYRLKIAHANAQADYLLWQYEILKDWVLSKPAHYAKTASIRFRTISHLELTELRNIFYKGVIKIIPKNIQGYLTPLVMAVWFMDDGNALKEGGIIRGYHLNTQSFTFAENEILASVLKRNFDIACSVVRNNGKYRLYIGAKSRGKFRSLIQNFVVPSLQYKIQSTM